MVRGRPVNQSYRHAALAAADQGEADFTYVGQTNAAWVFRAFAPTAIAGSCQSSGDIQTQDVAFAATEFVFDCESQGSIQATAAASAYLYTQIDGRTGASWSIKTGQYGMMAVVLGKSLARGRIRSGASSYNPAADHGSILATTRTVAHIRTGA